MQTKEYLNQISRMNRMINNKLTEIISLLSIVNEEARKDELEKEYEKLLKRKKELK